MPNSPETMSTPRSALPNVYTNITIREIDFTTRFGRNWTALRDLMGIMNPIKKQSGSQLVSYTATVDLEDGDVPAGAIIPYSKATVVETVKDDITLEKYAKAVPIEEVNKYGAKIAVQKTDDAFLTQLQNKVMNDFYTFIVDDTYAMTGSYATFQMAVAMAVGKVVDKFKSMDRDITSTVAFVNTLDAYEYLGAATLTVQNEFGMNYIENFLGVNKLFLSSKIARGTVVATASENIVMYYIDPSEADIGELGLEYTVDGETNFIGFHANGNYSTAVGESYAIMGVKLWPEYADGIAIITVDANPLKAPTISPVDGSVTEPWGGRRADSFQNNVTVANGTIKGDLTFVEGGLAPSGYLAGDGYFLYLKWGDVDAAATSLLVGLQPSAGSGMQEGINDPDKTVVMKVASNDQNFVTIVSNDDKKTKTVYDLDLTFLPADNEGV